MKEIYKKNRKKLFSFLIAIIVIFGLVYFIFDLGNDKKTFYLYVDVDSDCDWSVQYDEESIIELSNLFYHDEFNEYLFKGISEGYVAVTLQCKYVDYESDLGIDYTLDQIVNEYNYTIKVDENLELSLIKASGTNTPPELYYNAK